MPDWYLSGNHQELWLEVKYLSKVPRIVDPTKLLTALQQMWLTDRAREGRNVAVLIGSPDAHVLYPGTLWKKPMDRSEFLDKGSKLNDLVAELIAFCGQTSAP